MQAPRWMPLLVATFALAQDAAPFQPEAANPWLPAWELRVRADRFSDPSDDSGSFRRTNLQLRLRWTWQWDSLKVEAGTRSALGSDSNRLNPPRWDQQPSNGSQMDVAHATLAGAREKVFGSLRLGFQELGLLVSPGLWDRNLRFLGAGAAGGLRSTDGLVQEAGLRLAAGRVRNLLGGEVDVAAAQAVLKLDRAAFSGNVHVAHWDLYWNSGIERLRALRGHPATDRQHLMLDAAGAGGKWHGPFPVELRGFKYRNGDTRETSEEFQALFGSQQRVWWPQFTYTWQRLSSTGTLYPVNGDEWWYYRSARGPRVEASLPLPGKWLAAFSYLRQTYNGEAHAVTRKLLTFTKRF